MSEALARAVILTIVFAWVISVVVLPAAVHGYTPPPEMNTVMGIVAGGAVAYLFTKRGENGKGSND